MIPCMITILFFSQGYSQVTKEKTKGIDLACPESLDVFRCEVGDFINLDLKPYWDSSFSAYYSKDYEKSIKNMLMYTRSNIYDYVALYMLACDYALLGKDTLAAKFLRKAVDAGFINLHHLKTDPDLNPVKGKEAFDTVFNHIESQLSELGQVVSIEAPSFHECRVMVPVDYDTSKTYPLVIGLHGWTGCAESFVNYWGMFKDPQFIFAVPEAPFAVSGLRNAYSWSENNYGNEVRLQSRLVSEQYIIATINQLSKRFRIADVYLMGHSQGANISYQIGLKNQKLINGIVLMGGSFDTTSVDKKILKSNKSLKVLIAHGKQDETVKYENAIRSKDYLERYGYNVTFADFDCGHTMSVEMVNKICEWLEKQWKK